jgi:hypothetical protein
MRRLPTNRRRSLGCNALGSRGRTGEDQGCSHLTARSPDQPPPIPGSVSLDVPGSRIAILPPP